MTNSLKCHSGISRRGSKLGGQNCFIPFYTYFWISHSIFYYSLSFSYSLAPTTHTPSLSLSPLTLSASQRLSQLMLNWLWHRNWGWNSPPPPKFDAKVFVFQTKIDGRVAGILLCSAHTPLLAPGHRYGMKSLEAKIKEPISGQEASAQW